MKMLVLAALLSVILTGPSVPKVYSTPEWVLVVVGLITCCVIGWQSWETRKSAQAAALNAEALINAERPWVMVQVEKLPGENAAKSVFQLNVFNYGKTPAHIITCKGPKAEHYRVPEQNLPIPPDYGTWGWNRRFLAPKDSFAIGQLIDPSSLIRQAIAAEWESEQKESDGRLTLVVYGLIEYSDGVSPTLYKTAFCYRHSRDKLSEMGGSFIPFGPAVYNEYN
jgi:hypothetical protein